MSKLGIKILIMIVIISFLSMASLVALNIVTFNSEFSELQGQIYLDANDAARIMDGNLLEAAIANGTMDSAEYIQLRESLVIFKNDRDIKYLYTMYRTEDGNFFFAVDGSIVDPSELGEAYPSSEELVATMNGSISVTGEYTDEYGTFISAYAPIKNASGKIVGLVGADKDVATFVNLKNKLNRYILFAALAIITLAAVATFIFSQGISKNVRKIRGALTSMSEGDLSIRLQISSYDEFADIAKVIGNLRERFNASMGHVAGTSQSVMEYSESLSALSEEMAATSKEVSSAIDNVAQSTSEQAEEFDNISKIISGFGEKIDEVTQTVDTLNNHIAVINEKAKGSNRDLSRMEQYLNEVLSSFSSMSDKIKGFGQHLSRINDITNVINSIADQTNMIALNASIEAARAGDLGRGFAVVADEIRKLAEQSKDSSATINELLQAVSKESGVVVEISADMNRKLSDEISIIKKSVNSFKEIVGSMEEVFPKMGVINQNIIAIDSEKGHILASISSVTEKSEQISAAAEQISASSQESSISSQEVAEAAQNLITKAQGMVDAVHQFKVEK